MQELLTPNQRCYRNVQAWLKEYELEFVNIITWGPLMPQEDRCFIEWNDALFTYLIAEFPPWRRAIKEHKPMGCVTAKSGWREPRAWYSAQLISHHYDPFNLRFFEIDFDKCNPDYGLLPMLGHGVVEWLPNSVFKIKTDPFSVAKCRGWNNA